jgi:broad specificity phosphatase PhoE
LNENGKQQAKPLGTLIQRGEHYDIIMASPLSRAYETAKIIAKELDYHHSILLNDRFVERDFHHLDGTPVETAMPLVRSKNYSHGAYETDTMQIERIKRLRWIFTTNILINQFY